MAEPIYTIPPDTVIHSEYIVIQGASPWTRPPEVWEPIWQAGIDGRGITCANLDTGYKAHGFLPTPIAERVFTGEANTDRNGHGTHTIGSILGRGGIGGAPAASLVVGKVLSNSGSGGNTAQGLEWVADLAVEKQIGVLSCSWGGGGSVGSRTTAALRELERLGVWIFFAAGNSGYNGANTVIAPAISPHNLAVSSVTQTGAPSGFSSGGPAVDVADGGSSIISCGLNNNLVSMSGTSMATPTAAGSFALLRQTMMRLGMDVILNSRQLVAFVTSAGFLQDAGAPGDDPRYGEGIVDMAIIDKWIAKKALELS